MGLLREQSLLIGYSIQFLNVDLRVIYAARICLDVLISIRLVVILHPHLNLYDLGLDDVCIFYALEFLSSNNSKQGSDHAVSRRKRQSK